MKEGIFGIVKELDLWYKRYAMEITHLGHACFRLRGKAVTLVVDPFSEETGLKMPKVTADAVLTTHGHSDHHNLSKVEGYRVLIEKPGEYEVSGAQILGITAPHDKSHGSERGQVTLYQIKMDSLTIVHLGDLGDKLDEKQVEELNGADILMIPVGGVFTIDPHLASEVIAQIEPKIVIPMHYFVPGLKYNLLPLENFLKEMGKEDVKPQLKLVITQEKLPEEMEVVVLE